MAVSVDSLGERGHIVVVVWLLERADDADTRAARLAVEPDQLSVVCTTNHVLLLDVHVDQTVMLCHLHSIRPNSLYR